MWLCTFRPPQVYRYWLNHTDTWIDCRSRPISYRNTTSSNCQSRIQDQLKCNNPAGVILLIEAGQIYRRSLRMPSPDHQVALLVDECWIDRRILVPKHFLSLSSKFLTPFYRDRIFNGGISFNQYAKLCGKSSTGIPFTTCWNFLWVSFCAELSFFAMSGFAVLADLLSQDWRRATITKITARRDFIIGCVEDSQTR
jgi:hypothetical protein